MNKTRGLCEAAELLDGEKLVNHGAPMKGAGLAKVKIDAAVFQVLLRKRRAGETVRMALERAILTL